MRNNNPKLTELDVLKQAKVDLGEELKFESTGYACTTEQVLHILLGVAASKGTLESVCAELKTTVCAATVRSYLKARVKVEELLWLESSINRILAGKVPSHLSVRAQEVAIDYHDQSYYGRSEQEEGFWVRAEAKNGTTRVYRVATVYVILRGLRFTLGIKFVSCNDDNKMVLKFLLKSLKRLKIKVRTLYLDRGFAGVNVIKYLRGSGQSAVIACPIRGKTGGLKAKCVGRVSYSTNHTFKSAKHGVARVKVALCRIFTRRKRRVGKSSNLQWFCFILINSSMKAKEVRKKYRRRFGIETSYRCSRQVRGWTSGRNAAYRFLLISLSFILLNVWISLRWLFGRKKRRGGRLLVESHFRLRRFARFIVNALETLYGRVSHIEALAEVKHCT